MAKVLPKPLDWGSLATERKLSPEEIHARAQDLLAQMTLEEKIAQMSGDMALLSGILDMVGTSAQDEGLVECEFNIVS